MALVRKLLPDEDNHDSVDIPLPAELEVEVRKALQMMLPRPVIDVLVRYFVAEVNWIDQLLHPPWFLSQYQKWWNLNTLSLAGVEFAVLFLRVCCYASLFLPSPSHTIDSVKGVSLVNIRRSCEELIKALLPVCRQLDPRGSLVRVQYIAFAGLASISVGPMDAFWEHVSCASRVAQQIGLHLDSSLWPESMDGIEKEMRRRMFCNLYVWDSCLSKRLHRLPFLPDDALSDDTLPRMRLLREPDMGADAPDVFTERLLRAQLARFWRNYTPQRGPVIEPNKYDAVAAEERYEAFCKAFLPTIPPAFALAQPDRQWDARLATLPKQRQLLHMAVFEFLCWNFRPTLLQPADGYVAGYKQVLLSHGKRALAAAALGLLESVSALHALMGGSHTRFSGIIMPIFEGAVPLLCLCADPSFPGPREEDRESRPLTPTPAGAHGSRPRSGPRLQSLEMVMKRMRSDPLGARLNSVTRSECMQAARGALATLQTLAEVSEMAEVGARTLARLIDTVDGRRSSSSIATSSPPPPAPPLAPQASSRADTVSMGGAGQHDGGGAWAGTADHRDAVIPRPQPAVDAIAHWAYDPGMHPESAGTAGSHPKFPFAAGDMGISVGATVGAENWEGFFREFTGGYGL
ncbi:putative trascription factor [Diaporthe ampelina]|uniref:Putative trascription factor n=1 Tax=Diaporthe ampelina TaxID=1214573 RepID=A0A0G2F5R5_9PEZI|nr:putative trascription factor [Diaporthe ampelina]